MARVALAAAVFTALAVAAPAQTALAGTQSPQELRGFMLRANEPTVHTFSRTPSFAWNPVAGARSYEFQLATSRSFNDNGMVWQKEGVKSPAISIPISLPWVTGKPYSLYARVRALTRRGTTPWSAPFGFNMRWSTLPVPLTPSYPGLLRWTNVPGASGYQLWLVDAGKWFTTRTNEADEREYYTFHQNSAFSGVVHWRVRATRWLYGEPENGLPSVSYGPWSPVYSSYNPPFSVGPLRPEATVSNVVSNATRAHAHEIMPAFAYAGDTSLAGTPQELYRVEVFTDEDCLNVVFRGAIVGSPAYVPRPTGPLALPGDVAGITAARSAFLPDGAEPDSYTYDYIPVKSTESTSSAPSGDSHSSLPPSLTVSGAHVDLWDSDWPGGRYYWGVMPIEAVASETVSTTLAAPTAPGASTITLADASGIRAGDALQVGSVAENAIVKKVAGNDVTLASGVAAFHAAGEPVVRPGGRVTYREAELSQDLCASARVLAFGKSSEPVVTGQVAPFASGLSPEGKLVGAARSQPRFYGQPLVAWQPTVAADQYEVQWSRTRYPWKTAGSQLTWGTSATLPLTPGTWFYRVRGLDSLLMGSKPQMSWSAPVKLVVTKPRFRVVR